jgi:shikimate dehydrogenase
VSAPARYRVGVIGDPISHSISPAMHQPAFDALGIAATYERWHTTETDLPARIESLRASDMLGANVTVPHKLAVMEHVDEISPLAKRAGAVNTIVNQNGRLFGDNTDVYGFATSLISACPNAPRQRALVLGAGGAARAVVLGLNQIGVTAITVANRDIDRAERLVRDLAPIIVEAICLDADMLPHAVKQAGILVNATSLGWHRGEWPLAPTLLVDLPADAIVVDLTYRDTDLLDTARECGLATLDGLPMLVHQGARAFELFTGQTAPIDIMMAAALQAREAGK